MDKNLLQTAQNYKAPNDLLKGKNILVTGAGDGIGWQAALSFAKHGATILLLGRTVEKLEAIYDKIESEGYPQAAILELDLKSSNYDDYQNIHDGIEREFGKLDGLLHNASLLSDMRPIAHSKPQDWLDVMQVNANAPYLLTKALLPLLEAANNASVIFTSSSVGRKGRAYWGAYSVSKFATEGLMQVLADELDATSNIRVNSLNPGRTNTRMRRSAYPAEDPNKNPLAIAHMPVYLYLMGDDSLDVNGQQIDVQSH